jgi:hypothetical protein
VGGGGGAERGILEERTVSFGDSIGGSNDEAEETANQVAGKCLWRNEVGM